MLMTRVLCYLLKIIEELKIKINFTLDCMMGWFSANGLALNTEKTNEMKFTLCYQQNEAFQIIYIYIHTHTDNTRIIFQIIYK